MDPMLTKTIFVTLALSIVLQIFMGMIRWYKEKEAFLTFMWGIRHQLIIISIGIGLFFFPLVPAEVSYFFMTGPDSSSNSNNLVKVAVFIGMVSTYWVATQPMPKNDWKRIMFVLVAIPFLLEGILYLVNDTLYALSIEYGAMGISVGLILLQILMLVRAPWDVYTARTHSLRDYYDNIRPYHPSLSRSKKIMDEYEANKK